MPEAAPEPNLSPAEIGLLTVVQRRASVRTPRCVDQRNDVADIERLILLQRLAQRGLVVEADAAETKDIAEFTITDAGRALLQAADKAPPPPQGLV